MKKTFRAVAIATATAMGTSGVVVALPQAAMIANAQTSDDTLSWYDSEPAADGRTYSPNVNTYQTVAQLRQIYFQAASDWQRRSAQNGQQAPDNVMASYLRSENQAKIAKARFALALLQAEGNADARALDLSKVGIDKQETEKALAVLEPATQVAKENADADGAERGTVNRSKFFADGLSAVKLLLSENTAGAQSYEFNALSVVNWEIPDNLTQSRIQEFEYGAIDTTVTGQLVLNAAINGDVAKVAADSKANGAENETYLKEKFGELVAPKPADTTPPESPSSETPAPVVPSSSESPAPVEPLDSSTPAPTPSSSDAPKPAEPSNSSTPAPSSSATPAPSSSAAPKPSSSAAPAPSSSSATPKPAEPSSSAAPAPSSTQASEPSKSSSAKATGSDSIKKLSDQLKSSQGDKTLAIILAVVAIVGGIAAAAFPFWPQLRQLFKF